MNDTLQNEFTKLSGYDISLDRSSVSTGFIEVNPQTVQGHDRVIGEVEAV